MLSGWEKSRDGNSGCDGCRKAAARCPLPAARYPLPEIVAKSIKALNHREHREHKGKEKLFFVLFVFSVVPFFSEPFATPSTRVCFCGQRAAGSGRRLFYQRTRFSHSNSSEEESSSRGLLDGECLSGYSSKGWNLLSSSISSRGPRQLLIASSS